MVGRAEHWLGEGCRTGVRRSQVLPLWDFVFANSLALHQRQEQDVVQAHFIYDFSV